MQIFDFETYLFDMDGVIADSNPTHKLAFQHFLATKNIDCTDAFFEKHIAGNHNTAIVKSILGNQADQATIVEWSNAKEQYWRNLFAKQPLTIEGVVPFIKKLHSLGKKLAVCTSAPIENLTFLLTTFDLHAYFPVQLCDQDVVNHKPSPDVYLKACKLLQTDPKNAVVFEDSEKGAAAGLSAGCKVITINNAALINEKYFMSITNFSHF
jgi:beta-phosphoglucomutase